MIYILLIFEDVILVNLNLGNNGYNYNNSKKLKHINNLSTLKNLEHLNVSGHKISDLSILDNFKNLLSFKMSNNTAKVNSFLPITRLSKLRYLHIDFRSHKDYELYKENILFSNLRDIFDNELSVSEFKKIVYKVERSERLKTLFS